MTPDHFLTTQNRSVKQIHSLLDHARELRDEPIQPLLEGKSIALLFFNPSLRTRSSFEIGAFQLGAHAVVLEPGKSSWEMAFGDGDVMDGDAEEHVREAARVLSRYCDLIAVRCFPKFHNWAEDLEDRVLQGFAKHATVPVINMESIVHPCQELAHALTLHDHIGDFSQQKYVLTWTYHPRPLNTAVANSSLLIASKLGMNVTLLCPDERYLLDPFFMDAAQHNAEASGGSLSVSHDIKQAYDGANVVYAKSWGSLAMFGDREAERTVRDQYKHFIVDEHKMSRTDDAWFSHCLPARRNVKATDGVMDSPKSLIIEEAENRLHVQKALMASLCNTPAHQPA
jgi:N-acetylornithine carbamoyltransferase